MSRRLREPRNEIERKILALGPNDVERGKVLGVSEDSVMRLRLYDRVPRRLAAKLAAEPTLTLNDLIDRVASPVASTIADSAISH